METSRVTPGRLPSEWEAWYSVFYGLQVFSAVAVALIESAPTSTAGFLEFAGEVSPAVIAITGWTLGAIGLLEVVTLKAVKKAEKRGEERGEERIFAANRAWAENGQQGPPPGVPPEKWKQKPSK